MNANDALTIEQKQEVRQVAQDKLAAHLVSNGPEDACEKTATVQHEPLLEVGQSGTSFKFTLN